MKNKTNNYKKYLTYFKGKTLKEIEGTNYFDVKFIEKKKYSDIRFNYSNEYFIIRYNEEDKNTFLKIREFAQSNEGRNFLNLIKLSVERLGNYLCKDDEMFYKALCETIEKYEK